MRKAIPIIITVLVISTFHLALTILPENVRAKTLYVGGPGPSNYTTIQDAINAANPGDTVYVYKGTYYENVVIDKTLSLRGEDRNTTMINGSATGDIVNVTADWVNITGFTVENSSAGPPSAGIKLSYANNCNIANNEGSILLWYSHNNTIANNTGSNKWAGILLWYSSNNTLVNNAMSEVGIYVNGDSLEHWNTHSIDTTNTVNGKPVYYWKNVGGGTIPSGAGQVILANCTNVVVENKNVSNAIVGISLGFSSNNTIVNNTASKNLEGIYLYKSNNNFITKNNASNCSSIGVRLLESNSNTIANNTLMNNYHGLYLDSSSDNTVSNNTASLSKGTGIILFYSDGNTFTNNSASSNFGDGISLASSDGIALINNTASNNRQGIDFFCSNGIINNNIVSHNEVGINFTWSGSSTIINNNISNNWDGIFLDFFSSNNIIANNNIYSNDRHGIYLLESGNNIIANNNISLNNGEGISVDTSRSNSFVSNNVSNNRHGISLDLSDNNNITSNNFSSNKERGVFFWFSHDNTIANNTASNNRYGIYLSGSGNNIIANNTVFSNNQFGIVFAASGNNIIADTTVSSNERGGIDIFFSNNNTITNNTVTSNNGTSIDLYTSEYNTIAHNNVSNNVEGIFLWFSDNNTMDSNRASSNSAMGIELDDSSNNTVSNNTINGNDYGIYLDSSHRNAIIRNEVSLNAIRGISLRISSQNGIYHNSILSNAQQAFDDNSSNQWDDGYPSGGNFWSDYAGFDIYSGPNQDRLGSDGIGDTPYVIDFDSADRYPLTSPFPPLAPMPPFPLSATLTGTGFENVTLTWELSPDDGQRLKSVVRYDIYRDTSYNPDGTGYAFLTSVSNGTSQFVDVLAGEGDPNSYFYLVCAVSVNNSSRCSVQQLGKFTRTLGTGLNLVSIPLPQSDEGIGTVLQTVSFDKAWFYDSSEQEWESHMTAKPYPKGLGPVNHTLGFWINVTKDSNLTVAGLVPFNTTIYLRAGWNLVGFPSFLNYTVANLKAAIAVKRIEGFDALAPPYYLRAFQDSDLLLAGQGYWVEVVGDATWVLSNT